MSILQTNRQLRIKTPLGANKLLLYQLQAVDELGRLFEYQADLLSEDDAIVLDDLLGQRVDIELGLTSGGLRHFNAFVSRFTQVGVVGDLFHYQAVLNPWPWFLTLTSDCRIYQNLTVPQILTQIFNDNGFSDFELCLSDNYRVWEYCVQFRESDFDFISRLMEEEGIYYFFNHTPGKHILVLCDEYSSHAPLSGGSTLTFHPHPGAAGQRGQDIVTGWRASKSVRTGRYAHTDFDFEKPRAELLVSAPVPRGHPHGDYERFDYPGSYVQVAEGETSARHRIEALQAEHEQLEGEADVRHLSVGGLFNLTGHPRGDQNREYLVTQTRIALKADPYLAGTLVNLGETYACEFTCIPSKSGYRSLRTTPKPRVDGPQTAVVVGPKGEEIYTDKYGRIKVQFHWDRYGERNENSSCWVRVAQVWAGKNWGAMHIPRIGQEVIVEFLDGDPDRPIVTGAVYNAEQMPPWNLPGNQTQSGILSRSSKGGSQSNANAIRFEDKLGEEQLWLHAEKDQLGEVENDETKWVGNDRTKKVDGNETMTIGRNQTLSVGGNQTETVGQAKMENITLAKSLGIGAAYQISVGGAMNTSVVLGQGEEIGLAKEVMVGSQYNVTVGDTYALSAKNSIDLQIKDENSSLNIAKNDHITLQIGPCLLTLQKTDGTITLQVGEGGSKLRMASDSITLQVKDNSLEVNEAGVFLAAGGEACKKALKNDGTVVLSGSDVTLLGKNKLKLNS